MRYFFGIPLIFFFSFINDARGDNLKTLLGDNKFFYFAYGSDMSAKRLNAGNHGPDNFLMHSPAYLLKHRLDFITEVPWWNGALPTICKDSGEIVWGVVYIVKWEYRKHIETIKGVPLGWCHEQDIRVVTPDGNKIAAITYVQNHSPRKIPRRQHRPIDRRPSTTYLKIMIMGATEAGIPSRYIDYLYTIPHNGRRATEEVFQMLGPPFSDGSPAENKTQGMILYF